MRFIHLRPMRDEVTGKPVTGIFMFEAETQHDYDAAVAAIDAALFPADDDDTTEGGKHEA